MANIPVERRTGGGWWKWLLALLVIALLIWLLWSWLGGGGELEYETETNEIGRVQPRGSGMPAVPGHGTLSFAVVTSRQAPTTPGGTACLV